MKMNGAPDISISDAVALDNSVFVGTNQGLYRVTTDDWERLPFYGPPIYSCIVAAESELYVITGLDFTPKGQVHLFGESIGLDHSVEILKSPPKIFRSTDLGNTWIDISPAVGKEADGKLWMELRPQITIPTSDVQRYPISRRWRKARW